MELTQKQLKNRWVDIKKQIKERPLLAYRTGIPLSEWDKYIHSTPEASEINRIYTEIQNDRKIKTLRIKEMLSKIVGYRESADFARKSGVSNSYISAIIEGKKDMAGYDVINRLEVFLHLITGFEISLENTLNVKEFSQQLMDEIRKDIEVVERSLNRLNNELYKIGRTMKFDDDYYYKQNPVKSIQNCTDELDKIKEKLVNYIDLYLKNK